MEEITFNDVCILATVVVLFVVVTVYFISEIRWIDKGMRSLKEIEAELEKMKQEEETK